MKKLFLFLTAIVIAFVSAYAADDLSVSDQNTKMQNQIDSLNSRIVKLEEKINYMTRELAYQRLDSWIKQIINEFNIQKNSVDRLDNFVFVCKIHKQLNRKAKEVFMESVELDEELAETTNGDLDRWKSLLDLYNESDFFTKDEMELLNNRYLAALVANSRLGISIKGVKSKLD